MLSAVCFDFDQPKILSSGNGIKSNSYCISTFLFQTNYFIVSIFYPSSDNNILALSKLKAFADKK